MLNNVLKNEYYGDDIRWFIGKAKTTIQDPLNLGRIRVRIFGLHTEDTSLIPEDDLPWASISLSTNVFNGLGRYQAHGINDNDTVFGIFFDGKLSQQPLVLGVIPHMGDIHENFELPNDPTIPVNNEIITSPNQIKTDILIPKGNTIKNIPPLEGSIKTSSDGKNIGQNLPQSVLDSYTEIGFNFFASELAALGSSYPKEQAAGLIGNFIGESKMNPTIKAFGTENSWGIAQWNGAKAAGNRLGMLQDFAAKINLPWNELEAQLKYTIWELQNVTLGTSRTGFISINSLMKRTSVKDATRLVLDAYEMPNVVGNYYKTRPASEQSRNEYISELNTRLGYANNVYRSFA